MPGPPTVPKLKLGHVLKPGSKGGSSAASSRRYLFDSSRSGVPSSRWTSRSQLDSVRSGGPSARVDWREGCIEEDGFDPRVFLGTWEDNLFHTITVTECQQRRRGRHSYSAKFRRDGGHDKTFTISRNRGEWTCGNGRFVRGESSNDELIWRSEDGRESDWVRVSKADVIGKSAPIISNSHEDWPTLGGFASKTLAFSPTPRGPGVSTSRTDAAVHASRHTLSASASEFVPHILNTARALGGVTTPSPTPRETFDIATPMGTPALRPQPSPLLGPRLSGMRSGPSLEIEMLQESPDVCVMPEGRLEWVLPDVWKDLGALPQNFCVSSPLFGVEQAPCLQLVFYPSGSRTTEQGQCTIALLRGPECAGLKFELTLNGRCGGPKACVGHQYLGDFPRPCDAADGSPQNIIIGFKILETFETRA